MKLVIDKGTKTALMAALSRESGSFLLTGVEGSGKYYALVTLSQQLPSKPQITSVTVIKKTIGIEQIQDLNRQLRLKVGPNQLRVVIIRDAEKMTLAAQNAALKTLEEPAINTLIFLTTHQKSLLLPTIVSRLQEIAFKPPSTQEVLEYLTSELQLSQAKAQEIAELAGYVVGKAVELSSRLDLFENLLRNRRLAQQLYATTEPYQAFQLLQAAGDIDIEAVLGELIALLRQRLRESAKSDNISEIALYNRQLQRYHQMLSYLEANGSPKLALNQIVLSK